MDEEPWVLEAVRRMYPLVAGMLRPFPVGEWEERLPAVAEALRRHGVPLVTLTGGIEGDELMINMRIVMPVGFG